MLGDSNYMGLVLGLVFIFVAECFQTGFPLSPYINAARKGIRRLSVH
jgi:hypothetical protein